VHETGVGVGPVPGAARLFERTASVIPTATATMSSEPTPKPIHGRYRRRGWAVTSRGAEVTPWVAAGSPWSTLLLKRGSL
jgi:hypothetical protein